ncbi:MAG: cryptochrome/photolyase family protein, partial [Pseudomonadota bacterium]
MSTTLLVFPHQLFAGHPGLEHSPSTIILIEDSLFFGDPQYPAMFHKQKLWLHRASMARYAKELDARGYSIEYCAYQAGEVTLKNVLQDIQESGGVEVIACDPIDFTLEKRLQRMCGDFGLDLTLLASPMFLNTREQNQSWRAGQKRWFMAEFYKAQRTRLDILMDGDEPVGRQWSFDEDNRKKVPKKLLSTVPQLKPIAPDDIDKDARISVDAQFGNHYGSLDHLYWPTSHTGAAAWLNQFLKDRFELFGPYEDAIVEGETLLWHSAITPMLNIGLLTPAQVVGAAQKHLSAHDVPLNSAEGFIR